MINGPYPTPIAQDTSGGDHRIRKLEDDIADLHLRILLADDTVSFLEKVVLVLAGTVAFMFTMYIFS